MNTRIKKFGISIALGVAGMSSVAAGATLFRLPFASNPGYYGFYDHDSGSGFKRYDCATGYNYNGHTGTDFSSSMGTTIVAGAYGSLYHRVDGCPDDGSNQTCGGSYGNHVRVSHPSDGQVSIYAHMKYGTPYWPQSVSCGGTVGLSGNSGRSTAPHMHFELWQNTGIGQRRDFFSGACNATGYWVNQNGGLPTTTCQ